MEGMAPEDNAALAVESFGVLRLQLVVDWMHLFVCCVQSLTVLGVGGLGLGCGHVKSGTFLEGLGLVFASMVLWAVVVV